VVNQNEEAQEAVIKVSS